MPASETSSQPDSPSPELALATTERPKAAPTQAELDGVIRKRVYAAMALGLAPLPLLDLVGFYAIQIELAKALAQKYEVPFKEDRAKALIGALLGSVLPIALAPAAFSLAKLLPIVGQTLAASSLSLVGGAATYAMGQVFAKHFASGGALLQCDAGPLREAFKKSFEEGKTLVGKLGKKKTAQDLDEPKPAN